MRSRPFQSYVVPTHARFRALVYVAGAATLIFMLSCGPNAPRHDCNWQKPEQIRKPLPNCKLIKVKHPFVVWAIKPNDKRHETYQPVTIVDWDCPDGWKSEEIEWKGHGQ